VDPAASETTQDWLVPEGSRPPLIGELEGRIEEALATARASEAAVMTVGAAALDAAEQARRAADLAERASRAIAERAEATVAGGAAKPSSRDFPEGSLGDFSERADRLVARLRRLQRIPLAEPAASDVSEQLRSAR
jgi:hypothetical protein